MLKDPFGRVHNWSILNSFCPDQKFDLLASTRRSLCHSVNQLFALIGQKTEATGIIV